MTQKNKPKSTQIKPHFGRDGKLNLPKGGFLKFTENLDKEGSNDEFAFLFKRSYPQLTQLKTITAFRVYLTLFLFLIERKTYKLNISQADIARYLGCAGAEVCKAIAELENVELVLSHSRGNIVLNPRYLWRGSLAEWQKAVKETEQIEIGE